MIRYAAPASAIAILMSSTAAFADVTADEVWADMRGLLEGAGNSVTVGSEVKSGNTLTVQGIVIDASMAEAKSSSTLDQIAFVERGDGTVEVQLSPEYRVVSNSVVDGENVEMHVTMRHSALSIVVSGDSDNKTYTYSAASIGLEMNELATQDGPAPVNVMIDVAQPSGKYESRSEAAGHALDSTFGAAGATVKIDGTDGNSDKIALNMTLSDLTGESQGFFPTTGSPEDMTSYLRDGFVARGKIDYGSNRYAMSYDDDGTQTTLDGQDEGGAFSFAMGPDGLSYGVDARKAALTMKSLALPMPEAAVSFEQAAFHLAMPLLQSDEPQDFGMTNTLRGLTMSDGLWALLDPTGTLPHDPATVSLVLSGKARWLADIFKPESMQGASLPGELSSLSIDGFEVSMVGAALTGTGAFTFDNSDLTTFDGIPRPQGTADLKLVGGNGLLDKLVTMGLLPQDQATSFRMMTGLFAKPGDGDDTLVSNIEVTPEGQVLANGQRLR